MKVPSCCGSHKALAAEYVIKFTSLFLYLAVYLACQLCSNAEHIHSPNAVPDWRCVWTTFKLLCLCMLSV